MRIRKLFKKKDRKYAVLNDLISVEKVEFNIFNENKISFSDKSSMNAVCLNCPETPCIKYSKSELTVGVLPQMPSNKSKEVCPVDAIKIDENGSPAINTDSCISCGICLSRCDYGAINFTPTKEVNISKGDSHLFTWIDNISPTQESKRLALYQTAKQTLSLIHI